MRLVEVGVLAAVEPDRDVKRIEDWLLQVDEDDTLDDLASLETYHVVLELDKNVTAFENFLLLGCLFKTHLKDSILK